MRVYKFYPAKWGLEALSKRRLKVSPIDELNDPFEYLSLDLGEKSVRAWAKEFRKIVTEDNGIISFSSNWSQPLMWAHYADSHKGVALGFEIPERLLFKIDYVENRIKPTMDVDHSRASMKILVQKLLRTKHSEWSYEKEFRLVRPLKNCIREGNNFFTDFNETTPLKEVILGARYQTSHAEQLSSELKSEGISFQTARAEFKGFRMTTQKSAGLQKQL
ncbi:DUF2971 domain-containing protein [Allosediminivita pacifica]|uniref:DUF2971 domain-containing protein n=1 Tax=Allosediminivita pacifica TaxID=1267769 RepID=A0A2T6B0T0_9RHOB|nr:DUF2971 domain-containing protein [Allosediminivita pacifica]PTX49632.1 hypothetical protein C8N44_1067 [Allosediminivita pacifica]GGB03392.1 hypothetical protein GCM10011324_11980 [Allosediminivita pacifica]